VSTRLKPSVRWLLALGLVGLGAYLTWRGWSYYRLDLDARVEHVDFRALRPSGVVGQGYGVAGTALIATNLLYLVRRRLASRRLGSMRLWLDLHVFTGLAGAMLIAFHSAFQLRSAVATTTAASLGVVVLTGIVGRFIVALTPRDDGRLDAALAALDAALPGAGPRVRTILADHPAFRADARASLRQVLTLLPRWRREGDLRREAVRLEIGNDPALAALAPSRRAEVRALGRRTGDLAAAEVRAEAAAAFLRSWRSMHRLFALLMLTTVGVHIGVAWHYGYRWIF
jgi:hypothetical protein